MLKNKLLFIILLYAPALYAQVLTWSPVTSDTSDNPIDPAAIYYKLYYNMGSLPFLYASDHAETFVDLTFAPEGCYNLRVTAVRTDSSQELESDPSKSVYACVGGTTTSTLQQPQIPQDISYD